MQLSKNMLVYIKQGSRATANALQSHFSSYSCMYMYMVNQALKLSTDVLTICDETPPLLYMHLDLLPVDLFPSL